ncbi:MAG: hypothetical protein JNM10_12255 [Planctomycetia bacterium]|nr:hypothetical protein [Planctomycetia bacterium]
MNRGIRVGFAVVAAALLGGSDLLAGLLIVGGVAYILFTTGPDLASRRRRLRGERASGVGSRDA